VWLGVSVENQKWADIRIPALLDTPAVVRFVSAEPLLGPVRLRFSQCREHDFPGGGMCTFSCPGRTRLHWVITGGESGPGARPVDLGWVRSCRSGCRCGMRRRWRGGMRSGPGALSPPRCGSPGRGVWRRSAGVLMPPRPASCSRSGWPWTPRPRQTIEHRRATPRPPGEIAAARRDIAAAPAARRRIAHAPDSTGDRHSLMRSPPRLPLLPTRVSGEPRFA